MTAGSSGLTRESARPAAGTALSSHITYRDGGSFGSPNTLEGLDTVAAVSVHPVTNPATGTPASRKFPEAGLFPGNLPTCESLVPRLHSLSVLGRPVSLLPT